MGDQARHVKLGLFVAGGLVLAAAGAVVFGGGRFFTTGLAFETRVTESIQGLNVGAPVKLLGVSVGRVTDIGFAPHDGEGEHRVRVAGVLDVEDLPAHWRQDPEAGLRREIARGLRARLASVGLSGQLYVELDDVPDAPDKTAAADADGPVRIPSVPSLQRRLLGSAQTVVSKIADVDLPRLSTRLEEVLASIDRILREEAVPALREVAGAAAEVRRAAAGPELRDALAALPDVLARLEETLSQVGRLATAQEADLRRSMENVRAISEDLRRLSSRAERDPGGVLFGGPPAPVEPGRVR